MYIFKNALENIGRNIGRNILLGAIIFAVITTTAISLIINNTAKNIIEYQKDKFGSEVTISPDMDKIQPQQQSGGMVRMMAPSPVSSELLLEFTKSRYLKESIATGLVSASNDSIRAIDQSDDDEDGGSVNGYTSQGGATMMRMGGMGGNFRLLGDDWGDFNSGMRKLETGRMPESDNECLVGSELAQENDIRVGDILTFTAEMSMDYEPEEYSGIEIGDTMTINGIEYTASEAFMGGRAAREVEYELTVTGIYFDLTDAYPMEGMPAMASMNKRNEILTTLPTLLSGKKTDDERGLTLNVTFYLADPGDLALFEEDVRKMGLDDAYQVTTDADGYEKTVKPIESLKGISIVFMLIVLILGGMILLLLCSIAIRERKYEIGVLRAMGMKKLKVALGLWAEVFALTCICLLIGLSAGSIAAQPVSDVLLQAQVAEANSQAPAGPGGPGTIRMMGGMRIGGSVSEAKPLDEMDVSLGLDTVGQIILVAVFLSSLAGIVSISRITKYEPIKILMERN
ncbi:MAG: ABC transporter permease [Oscillospiraceae bacterium]|nr:ABC transporter permease [Oscillospiraceae bacterium]